jgi:hypothetical protein
MPPADHVPSGGRSGLAVASMVLGICGIAMCFLGVASLLAVIFGFVALSRIKRTRPLISGRGMALAGVWLGVVGLLTGIAFWVAAATGAFDDDSLATGDVKVGQCVNVSSDAGLASVREVKCADGHDGEVYKVASLGGDADAAYPGTEAVQREIVKLCAPDFEGYVGVAYGESDYEISYLYPTKPMWRGQDRSYVCIVSDPTGEDLVGSVKGADH